MGRRKKILLSWSGGKNSALSYFELRSPEYEVTGLLTTVTEADGRTQAHNFRRELIEAQALSLELPVHFVSLSPDASAESSAELMQAKLTSLKKTGIVGVAYGDLKVRNHRESREALLKKVGLKGVFPLLDWSSEQVSRAVTGLGYKALVTCVNSGKLPKTFIGRPYNLSFVQDLPSAVDPAGEKGEFHTFVSDGLFFQNSVPYKLGELYEKSGLTYQDLMLSQVEV